MIYDLFGLFPCGYFTPCITPVAPWSLVFPTNGGFWSGYLCVGDLVTVIRAVAGETLQHPRLPIVGGQSRHWTLGRKSIRQSSLELSSFSSLVVLARQRSWFLSHMVPLLAKYWHKKSSRLISAATSHFLNLAATSHFINLVATS